MQNAGYAALQIIPSFEGFQGNLERGSSGALIAAGSSGGRKYGDSAGRSMASAFTSHARRAALLGAGLLSGVGYAAFKFGQDALAEARESQKVGALTAQVIKTTGAAAGVTAKEVGDLSTALSLKTGVDDEVIQRGANMLLTFKNVRNEVGKNNDIFNQSVAITEDMAAAMAGGQGGNNLDLKSSSILVGKALNDPAKGLTALTRVGVTFTEQQKKNIDSLLEQNKRSEAQKVILKELQSEFGGAAEAQATLGEKVDTAWGNIQEKIGTALLPLVHDVERAFLHKAVPAIERFSDWFQHEGVTSIRNFIDDAKPLVNDLLPAAKTVFGDIRDVAHDALPYVKGVVEAFNDMPDWVQKGLTVGGVGAVAAGKLGLFSRGGGGAGGLLGGISKAAPLPVYVVNGTGGIPGVTGGGKPGGGITPLPGGKPGFPARPGMVGGSLLATGAVATGFGLADAYYGHPGTPVYSSGGYDLSSDAKVQDYVEMRKQVEATAELFKTLPSTVQTDIVLHGAPESKREAKELATTYDLTKAQRLTLFRTSGIPLSNRQVGDLIGLYRDAEKPRNTHVTADTTQAETALNRVISLMNQVSAGRYTDVAPKGQSAGSSSGRSGRRVVERPAHVYVDGQRFDGRIRDEIDADHDMTGERQRAGVQ